jgi:thiol-disulfide isomerase/thioredoxin
MVRNIIASPSTRSPKSGLDVSKPAEIVLVTAPGCHYCADAAHLLDEVGESTQLSVRTVPLSSDEGRALLVRHRIPYPPILLVDGSLFGYGRISKRRLVSYLAQRADADLAV